MVSIAFEPKRDQGAVLALLKAVAFFACAEGFNWALWGPLRTRYQNPTNKALAPLVGDYSGFAFLATIVTCVFLLLLTWIFLSLVEKRSLVDIGYGRAQRPQFWLGALAGFLPGLVLAVPLVASRFAETYSSPTHVIQYLLWMLLGALNLSLLACGYGLQILWRRFGGVPAVLVVALASNIRLALNHPQQWTIFDLSLQLLSGILVYVLLGWAFARGRTAWLPAGVSVGLSVAPIGGAVVGISWSYEKGHDLWKSSFWNFHFGILHIAILAAAALLIWWLNSGNTTSYGRKPLTDCYAFSWAVGCGLGFLLILQWALKFFDHPDPEFFTRNTDLLATASLVGLYGSAAFCFWLYRSWSAIRDAETPITPGRAVGLLLVPVYNLYWGFRALPGLATEYNRYLERHRLEIPSLSRGIYTLYVVLCLVCIVPVLGILAAPAAYVVGILMIRRTCSAMNALNSAESAAKIVRIITGVAGQVLNRRFEIPATGIVIGSTPGESKAILPLPHVGASHARLWADIAGQGLWVQDLESGEGTFCSPVGEAGGQWARITQPTLLTSGARLRLGSSAAEFQII